MDGSLQKSVSDFGCNIFKKPKAVKEDNGLQYETVVFSGCILVNRQES